MKLSRRQQAIVDMLASGEPVRRHKLMMAVGSKGYWALASMIGEIRDKTGLAIDAIAGFGYQLRAPIHEKTETKPDPEREALCKAVADHRARRFTKSQVATRLRITYAQVDDMWGAP